MPETPDVFEPSSGPEGEPLFARGASGSPVPENKGPDAVSSIDGRDVAGNVIAPADSAATITGIAKGASDAVKNVADADRELQNPAYDPNDTRIQPND